MSEIIPYLAGWIPAVILPMAALIQLLEIVRNKSAEGVSITAWMMFGLANIGLYIFTEKYFAIQSFVGLLGTALLNFAIAIYVMKIRKALNSKQVA